MKLKSQWFSKVTEISRSYGQLRCIYICVSLLLLLIACMVGIGADRKVKPKEEYV